MTPKEKGQPAGYDQIGKNEEQLDPGLKLAPGNQFQINELFAHAGDILALLEALTIDDQGNITLTKKLTIKNGGDIIIE